MEMQLQGSTLKKKKEKRKFFNGFNALAMQGMDVIHQKVGWEIGNTRRQESRVFSSNKSKRKKEKEKRDKKWK